MRGKPVVQDVRGPHANVYRYELIADIQRRNRALEMWPVAGGDPSQEFDAPRRFDDVERSRPLVLCRFPAQAGVERGGAGVMQPELSRAKLALHLVAFFDRPFEFPLPAPFEQLAVRREAVDQVDDRRRLNHDWPRNE